MIRKNPMKKISFSIVVLLFLVGNAAAQSLVGTYKLISFTSKFDDGTSYEFLGDLPVGYSVITPKLFTSILVSADRKAGNTADAKLALFNSIIAYSGPYTIEGSKLITSVEVSWNQAWTGTKQGRNWSVEGDKLILITDWAPSVKDPSKKASGHLVWQKIE